MDFNMKQWRSQRQDNDDESAASAPAKLPRLYLDSLKEEEEEENTNTNITANKTTTTREYSVSESLPELHLFVPTDHQQHISTKLNTNNNNMSAYPSSDHSTARLLPKEMMGGSSCCYFSYGQWQELELQALIYRHMQAGAAIPHQLIQLVHNSLFNTSSSTSSSTHNNNLSTSSYYLHPLQQHYSQYHPALLQSGYWERGVTDPEPGRCRRTDGKKWRCSRDVVGGQKYCERHVHRGRTRSRKPVELPTTSNLGGNNHIAGGDTAGGGGGATDNAFSSRAMSVSRPSMDHFRPSQRPSGMNIENEDSLKSGNGQVLRHFFDDWSRESNNSYSSTSLSISTPSSDFSLKLSTGDGNENGGVRERIQTSWGNAGWVPSNQVGPMGGPLAEALRSSLGSNASPTSVLNLVK